MTFLAVSDSVVWYMATVSFSLCYAVKIKPLSLCVDVDAACVKE